MPPAESFYYENQYYFLLMRQIGHATGHNSRLNRDVGPLGSESHAKETLRAEIIGYMINTSMGLGHDYAPHTSHYRKDWVSLIEKDKNVLFEAARDNTKRAIWCTCPLRRRRK